VALVALIQSQSGNQQKFKITYWAQSKRAHSRSSEKCYYWQKRLRRWWWMKEKDMVQPPWSPWHMPSHESLSHVTYLSTLFFSSTHFHVLLTLKIQSLSSKACTLSLLVQHSGMICVLSQTWSHCATNFGCAGASCHQPYLRLNFLRPIPYLPQTSEVHDLWFIIIMWHSMITVCSSIFLSILQ
jgi:hypothetical protein